MTKKLKKIKTAALATLFALGTLTACDSIDCSLYNTVQCVMGFYDSEGNAVQINDTLSITAVPNEEVLFNRGVGVQQVGFPLSYYKDKDTIEIVVWNKYSEWTQLLVIEKQNIEHFESLDCPVKMYHTLKGVTIQPGFVDSVKIESPNIEYNNGENIKIYLHPTE